MMPTAELAPLEPSKGFVEEKGVAWPQAAPVHVKTKSAWATNSAMGGRRGEKSYPGVSGGGVPAFPQAFRDDR